MTAPSWIDLVNATCVAAADAYARGYAAGVRDGREDRDAAQVWAGAAEVARNVVSDRSRTWAPAGQPQRRGWAS